MLWESFSQTQIVKPAANFCMTVKAKRQLTKIFKRTAIIYYKYIYIQSTSQHFDQEQLVLEQRDNYVPA